MIFKPLKSRKNRMLIISLSISFLVFCVCVFLISEKITAAAVAGISFQIGLGRLVGFSSVPID